MTNTTDVSTKQGNDLRATLAKLTKHSIDKSVA